MELKKKESVLKSLALGCSTFSICTGLLIICGLFFIVFGALIFVFIMDLSNYVIESQLPLSSTSDVIQYWIKPPIKPYLKVYIFNVTNPGDYLKGQKPKLQEVGPYFYEETWEKVNTKWTKNDTQVEFEQKKIYHFIENLSAGSDTDQVIIPNIPMIAAMAKLKNSSSLIKIALLSILQVFNQKPFVKLSVKKILWGYHNPLIKLGNDILPRDERFPFDKFGILIGKNGSTSGKFKIHSGVDNLSNLGEIMSFRGKDKLDVWSGDQCNDIRGTDGTIFPPGFAKNKTLYVFSPDLCQSLPLVFEKEIITNDIPGYRYIPPSNVFSGPAKNPRNKCFCDEKNKCMAQDGLMNISPCQYNSPIIISWPHFYQANPNLLNEVEGLNPDPEKHQFYIDIQPKLGSGLRAAVRSQINIAVTPMEGVGDSSKLRKGVFPLIWVDEGLDEIKNEEVLNLLNMAVNLPTGIKKFGAPTTIFIGVLLIIISLLMLFHRRHNNRVAQFPSVNKSTDSL
ncbi:scavenger receptor class B member 1 [Lepeophtheirus salmonis]|uniref:scavenger receptor class B member 1 n=1 Tax=Lepeophtheirus salmonis TaxID=72036 RepID=UPI001AE1AE63|nr:scavenger receptor class B member 1-like [Lepeophtheirus salmonis]